MENFRPSYDLKLQTFDEQDTPSDSEDSRSEDRKYGSEIDPALHLDKLGTFHSGADENPMKYSQRNRKILYRVGKKIYSPEEIELMKELIDSKLGRK